VQSALIEARPSPVPRATGPNGAEVNVNQQMISDGHAVPYFGGKR
jgi:endonuclease YncB( thermonuclease family)